METDFTDVVHAIDAEFCGDPMPMAIAIAQLRLKVKKLEASRDRMASWVKVMGDAATLLGQQESVGAPSGGA